MKDEQKQKLINFIDNHLKDLNETLKYNIEYFEDDWNTDHILAFICMKSDQLNKYPEIIKAKKQLKQSGSYYSMRK